MPATEIQINAIIDAYYQAARPAVPIEEVLAAAGLTLLEVTRKEIGQGIEPRGLELVNGEIVEKKEAAYKPAKADYSPFVRAARAVVDMIEKPISPADLIAATGLATEAIPSASMSYHLRPAGVYFIPGLGYWRSPQYTSDKGEMWSARFRGRKLKLAMELFKEHGWPLAGQQVEEMTSGEVTSRYMSLQAHRSNDPAILSIGGGLFVPAGVATDGQDIPMTSNVAEALLDQHHRKPIARMDDVRMYKLAHLLARNGMAEVKEITVVISGRRSRAVLMSLTEDGFKKLKGYDKRSKDEF